jgi:hypothetical protein
MPAQNQVKSSRTPDAGTLGDLDEDVEYVEEWPATIYMVCNFCLMSLSLRFIDAPKLLIQFFHVSQYLPLDELYDDWQSYVKSNSHQDSEEGREMRRVLLSCSQRWQERLKDVNQTLASSAAGLASAFIRFRENNKTDTKGKKPTTAEEFLDCLYFQRRYLTEAVNICNGGTWTSAKSDVMKNRSSFRASSSACVVM